MAAVVAVIVVHAPAAFAQTCTQEQISTAINRAGEKLRQMTAQTQPALQAKLLKLKDIKGWSETDYEEKGYNLLEDERTTKLDEAANHLLGRLDQMGNEAAGGAADCSRLAEIEAASLELQATVKAKSQYLQSRIDQLIGENRIAAAVVPAPAPSPPPAVVAPKAAAVSPPKQDPRWSTETKTLPQPPTPAPVLVPGPVPGQQPQQQAVVVQPVTPPPAAVPSVSNVPTDATEGFSIDEIVAASSNVFGRVSANLARVLEHTFAKSGKPTGYILGDESGAAFIAGLRYGKGTLYLRNGQSMPIYWHGPSLGADIGAQGAATLFLVYKAQQLDDVLSSFTGIEGSAFVVGGVGVTFMSNKRIDMAPIRSGLGLRIGANVGYVRFTQKPTWNPF